MVHDIRLTLMVRDLLAEAITGADLDGLGPADQSEYAIGGWQIKAGTFFQSSGELDLHIVVDTSRQAGANAGTGSVRERLIAALEGVEYLAVDA